MAAPNNYKKRLPSFITTLLKHLCIAVEFHLTDIDTFMCVCEWQWCSRLLEGSSILLMNLISLRGYIGLVTWKSNLTAVMATVGNITAEGLAELDVSLET